MGVTQQFRPGQHSSSGCKIRLLERLIESLLECGVMLSEGAAGLTAGLACSSAGRLMGNCRGLGILVCCASKTPAQLCEEFPVRGLNPPTAATVKIEITIDDMRAPRSVIQHRLKFQVMQL
jgi:hypothetical protein